MIYRRFGPAASVCVCTIAVLVLSSTHAEAQSFNAPPSTLGVRGFGTFGVTLPVAKDSFEAVALSTSPKEFGGGGELVNLWRRLFIQGALSRWSESGERAFVDATGERFALGIPLSVKATALDIGAGWRFAGFAERLVPYAGGGAGAVFYTERSAFAESGDDLDERFTSYHLFGGVDVALTRWLATGVDVRYRFVPDSLGEGGVSAVLGDDSLNGTSIALRVIVGR